MLASTGLAHILATMRHRSDQTSRQCRLHPGGYAMILAPTTRGCAATRCFRCASPSRARETSWRRRGSKSERGVTMVEFALVAPLGFLLFISVLVVGIVVTNYIQLGNEAREGARLAAICGSSQTALIPDGSGLACTGTNISAYITGRLISLPAGSVAPQISVISGSSSCSLTNPTCHCQLGSIVQVTMSYNQPLYFPLLSNVFESNPNGTILLSASAQATCEQ
jgi:hypothetical protein